VERKRIIITDYVTHRARTRGFDIQDIESIVRHSEEPFFDTETHRLVAVGRSAKRLVMIPYEENDEEVVPVTVHAVTRQQIRFRVSTGRFTHGEDNAVFP
jgi:hypothetical protein